MVSAPLLTGRWKDRPPILTGPFSHSPLLSSCLLTSPSSGSFSFALPRVAVSRAFGRHPLLQGAARTVRSRCVRVFQMAENCFTKPPLTEALTYVLSFDHRFSWSASVRVLSECLCHGVGGGAVMWVQMVGSDELSRLLVSSVQSLSLQDCFSQIFKWSLRCLQV